MPGISSNKESTKNDGCSIPVRKNYSAGCAYDIYPSYHIEDNRIFAGYDSLAERIGNNRTVMIDGYGGVFFDEIREGLRSLLRSKGFSSHWIFTSDLFRSEEEIMELTKPFLGGNDPLFGKRTSLTIRDYFRHGAVESVTPDPASDYNFVIGPGASLVQWNGLLLYADVAKNEIQRRARRGLITNLGVAAAGDPKEMYKSFYFVDWIILNRHKQEILQQIDVYIDSQRPGMPVWIEGEILRNSLSEMSRNIIRARPWFEPGAWGGTWIRDHIGGLDKNARNYAWSFELITPENGLIIESSSFLCEISFDCLMYHEAENVLGDCFSRFGTDFPVRFDYLDTFDGGNLSIQCHPQEEYMKEHFGEGFTQEEAYYILDTKNNASVFLGFRDDIDPGLFRDTLEKSFHTGKTIDPEDFILRHPSKKHDFFLIPPGTIHGSGKNNLVLEISSTPYIFTFKLYDWQRPDLDGKPRQLNISRGMENLCFERKGDYVNEQLISHPRLLEKGPDWELWHLPTHENHLYDVIRYRFMTGITIPTGNKCLVMNLVEGGCIEIKSRTGYIQKFSYAETFIIPAAAGMITVKNLADNEAILVAAFVK